MIKKVNFYTDTMYFEFYMEVFLHYYFLLKMLKILKMRFFTRIWIGQSLNSNSVGRENCNLSKTRLMFNSWLVAEFEPVWYTIYGFAKNGICEPAIWDLAAQLLVYSFNLTNPHKNKLSLYWGEIPKLAISTTERMWERKREEI